MKGRKKGLKNVEPILVAKEKLDLPEKSLDLIFMRNVYHCLQYRVDYFRKLGHFLKTDGKVAIIERNKPLTLHGIFGHHTHKKTIIKEMKKAGFVVNKEFDFLPNQFFIIFVKMI